MNQAAKRYDSLAFEGYKRAKTYSAWRYLFLFISFACLLYSVKATGAVLYATSFGALIALLISWALNQRQKAIRNDANALARQALLLSTFDAPNSFKLSHLVARTQTNRKESSKVTDEPGSDNNDPEDPEQRKLNLVKLIHENSFWNHHQYRELSLYYIIISVVIFVVATSFVVLAVPFHYLDPDYIAPRMAFSALSFTIVFEVMEHAIKLRTSSREMLEVDNELRQSYALSEDRLIDVYNTYVSVKESTPDIPQSLYEKNRDKLNDGWEIRGSFAGSS